ncbi:MAG: hypothetical protein ACI924_002322, partial [Flavobacterium sp.]
FFGFNLKSILFSSCAKLHLAFWKNSISGNLI